MYCFSQAAALTRLHGGFNTASALFAYSLHSLSLMICSAEGNKASLSNFLVTDAGSNSNGGCDRQGLAAHVLVRRIASKGDGVTSVQKSLVTSMILLTWMDMMATTHMMTMVLIV